MTSAIQPRRACLKEAHAEAYRKFRRSNDLIMSGFSIPLSELVHENLSVVLSYAYSQGPLRRMREKHFVGSLKYLDKTLFDLPALRAEKALMEMALFLRTLDDDANLSSSVSTKGSCGKLFMEDGSIEDLPFREVANKIIHAKSHDWNFNVSMDGDAEDQVATITCVNRPLTPKATKRYRWLKAEVDLVALAAVCAGIMH